MIDWLIDTLVANSLLMALVLLIRGPVRRQFGATVTYGLWVIPALRLMMPPVITTVERAAPIDGPLSLNSLHSSQAAVTPIAASGLLQQSGPWEAWVIAAWLAGAAAMLAWGFLVYR